MPTDTWRCVRCADTWSVRPDKGPDGEKPLCPECSDELWNDYYEEL